MKVVVYTFDNQATKDVKKMYCWFGQKGSWCGSHPGMV